MSTTADGSRIIISPDNKAALIVIVSAIGLSWTTLVLIIRIVSKLHVKRSIGLEEILVSAASTCAAASSCLTLASVKHGLGQRTQHLGPAGTELALKFLYIADIFYVLTLGTAKCGGLPLIKNLTPVKQHIIACYGLAVFSGLWTLLSIFLVALRCNLQDPWNDFSTTQCSSLLPRWAIIESFGLLIEISIFVLSLSIIYVLKMRWYAKLKVLFAFATRLPVIIPTVFRLVYLARGLPNDNDATFALTEAVIATQVVLHYTTIASSLAYLKPFLGAFDSNLGATVKVDTVVSNSGYHHNSRSAGSARNDRAKRHSRASVYVMEALNHNQHLDFSASDPYEKISPVSDAQHETPRHSKLIQVEDKGRNNIDSAVDWQKHESQDSVTPIITKIQEWQVHTESRDPIYHAI